MTPERTKFDDPRLRAAVRRAWAGETAPPELRRQVEELIAKETAAGQAGEPTPDVVIRRPALSFWRRSVTLGSVAAAAVVIVGVGLIAFNASRHRGAQSVATSTGNSTTPPAPAVLPTELGQQLVRGHDLCVRVHGDD